jgi:phosphoglycerate dehydrogenase-like enzyme
MTARQHRIRVGVACRADIVSDYLAPADLARLREFADVSIAVFDVDGDPWGVPNYVPEEERRLCEFAAELDALIVCHGAPRVTAAVFDAAPDLHLVGELEGDRFAGRIDVEAAHEFGVAVVDTTHGSSWPVAEWALALMLLGLREHGFYRSLIEGEPVAFDRLRIRARGRELTGKTIGMIGFGHIAWRLREFLEPFETPILAYDPFAARELAEAEKVDFTTLEKVMTCDVVVCLVPATPATAGMIGRDELALLREDAVFVNVSRGTVVDVDALVERAARNDAWFGLDAHDPEPIRVDSPLRGMRNVFLSPHIAGVTIESRTRFFSLMVDELRRYAEGVEPRAQITDRVIAGRGPRRKVTDDV